MKKILIGYKGIFLLPRLLSEGITESFLNDVKDIMDNHKEMIYNHFSDCHVDFIFSSYKEIDETIIDGYSIREWISNIFGEES